MEQIPSNTPMETPSMQTPPPAKSNGQLFGIISVVTGVIGLCLSFFFIFCGAPLSIVSIIFGILALRDPQGKTLGIIGLVISGGSLLLACLLAILGPTISTVFEQINQSLAP